MLVIFILIAAAVAISAAGLIRHAIGVRFADLPEAHEIDAAYARAARATVVPATPMPQRIHDVAA